MKLIVSLILLAIIGVHVGSACMGGCSKGFLCGGDGCGADSACHGFSPNCYCLMNNRMTAQERLVTDLITNICAISQNVTQPLIIGIFNRLDQRFMIRCQNGTIGGYIV